MQQFEPGALLGRPPGDFNAAAASCRLFVCNYNACILYIYIYIYVFVRILTHVHIIIFIIIIIIISAASLPDACARALVS